MKQIYISFASYYPNCLLHPVVQKMNRWKDYLQKIYYDPSHPGSYEGLNNLYQVVKQEGKFKISHKQIKDWLENQDTYSLNKAVRRNFQRGRVIVSGIDDQWDADLASFACDADQNDGYKYLFSQYLVNLLDRTIKN